MGLQSGKENWGAPSPGAAPGQVSSLGVSSQFGLEMPSKLVPAGTRKVRIPRG